MLWNLVMPLALSDDQLATIRQFAEPLHPNDRGRFLQRVAHLLQGCERDVGRIEQVCKMLKTCSREEVGDLTNHRFAVGVHGGCRGPDKLAPGNSEPSLPKIDDLSCMGRLLPLQRPAGYWRRRYQS